jgi:hypothetical protein
MIPKIRIFWQFFGTLFWPKQYRSKENASETTILNVLVLYPLLYTQLRTVHVKGLKYHI